MPLQLNIWLLLFGCLQGLLLSLVLAKKKAYRHGYGFLIAYLLVMMAQIFFKVADKQWLMEGSRNSYFLSYKFPLLYGPLIWFFARRLLQQVKTFSVGDLLHFLPFVYSVVVLNTRNDSDALSWLYWPIDTGPAFVLQMISLLVYHLLAWRLWQRHNQNIRESFSDIHAFQTQWMRRFIILSLAICLFVSLLTYLIYIWYPAHNWLRFGFLLLCVFIYWISYSALQQPAMFNGFGKERKLTNDEKPLPMLPALVVHRPVKKYAHSTLSEVEAEKITEMLDLFMRQKIYSDAGLTIETLASRLHCNRYVLSQVLNETIKKTFYEYINGWRVEAAKEMLADPAFDNHKIAAIGYDAGFNSLSTFNEVFKKITSLTPSQYKKQSAEDQHKQRV